MLAGPWIITGIFIYQSFISEAKGWNIFAYTKSFYVLLNNINIFINFIRFFSR